MEESLGYDMMEMSMRHYDPALGRFSTMDPVTHHQYSPYQGYDNNPIFWSDPSGADSDEYDHSQQTFFQSSFLNQSGGHWTDQLKGIDGDKKSEKNDDSSETQDSQEKGVCETCPKKIDLNESPESIINAFILWSRYIDNQNNERRNVSDALIRKVNAESDGVMKLLHFLFGTGASAENTTEFIYEDSGVIIGVQEGYFVGKPDNLLMSVYKDSRYIRVDGKKVMQYEINIRGPIPENCTNCGDIPIIFARFTDSNVRNSVLGKIRSDIYEEKFPDAPSTYHMKKF